MLSETAYSFLAEYAARKAAKMSVSTRRIEILLGSELARIALDIGDRVAQSLIDEQKGLPRCGLCGMGPFTYKGLYLHLIRKHFEEIRDYIEEEIEYTLRTYKNVAAP